MTSVGCFSFSILLGKYYSFIYDSNKHTQPSHRLTCTYTHVHIHTHTHMCTQTSTLMLLGYLITFFYINFKLVRG